MWIFASASLLPGVFILIAALQGGAWVWAALGLMTAGIYLLDRLVPARLPPQSASGIGVALAQAGLHAVLLPTVVWSLAHGGHPLQQALGLATSAGLYIGQVSNATAHELIHRTNRSVRRVGIVLYCSLLFGHHASAHMLVHHIWVATPKDPNSARRRESFYRFWIRAWIGSFRAGRLAESKRRIGESPLRHPYVGYGLGALAALMIAAAIGGLTGVLIWSGLSVFAQMQLMLSDYIQHYGLRRVIDDTGRAEPVGPMHSWNGGDWASSAMLLHAPRHSDHHMNPARPFPALRLTPDTLPHLPSTFPVMALLATCPPLWRSIMDPRVDAVLAQTHGIQPTHLTN